MTIRIVTRTNRVARNECHDRQQSNILVSLKLLSLADHLNQHSIIGSTLAPPALSSSDRCNAVVEFSTGQFLFDLTQVCLTSDLVAGFERLCELVCAPLHIGAQL
jgi:hypothetical protein